MENVILSSCDPVNADTHIQRFAEVQDSVCVVLVKQASAYTFRQLRA